MIENEAALGYADGTAKAIQRAFEGVGKLVSLAKGKLAGLVIEGGAPVT